MDRISDSNMQAVLASVESAVLVPPEALTGEARTMFLAIVANNRTRPWGQSHAYALADYCRVATMWDEQMRLVATEGPLVGGKPNARFKVTQMLSAERLRLGKLLGLAVGMRDRYLAGSGKTEERLREMGATVAASGNAEGGDLLA